MSTAATSNNNETATVRADIADIEQILRKAFSPSLLEVTDDSHQHIGHAGARSGGHYSVKIRCSAFNELTLIARHRAVYAALDSLMSQGIHALAIDAAGDQ